MESDEILDLAILYSLAKLEGRDNLYPSDTSKDKRRAIRRRAEKISVQDGKLLYENRGRKLVTIITRPDEQEKIIRACHIDETSGHFGVKKTAARVSERFYWRGMWNQAVSYVSP